MIFSHSLLYSDNNIIGPNKENQTMKIDYEGIVPDTNKLKRQIKNSVNDMKKNNIEISVRFSWLDLMLAVLGIAVIVMSFDWIRRLDKRICVKREAKKIARESE